jgi:hypothetical protein
MGHFHKGRAWVIRVIRVPARLSVCLHVCLPEEVQILAQCFGCGHASSCVDAPHPPDNSLLFFGFDQVNAYDDTEH